MAWPDNLPPAAQLPTGLAGMVNHENRLLSEPTELLTAEGVALDDLHARKEPGLAPYDTAGLQLLPSFRVTFTRTLGGAPTDTTVGGILATFPASVTGVSPVVGGTAATGTAAAAFAVSVTVPAGGYAMGSLVLVAVVLTNSAGAGAGVVADTGLNTYTRVDGVSLGGAGVTLVLYYSRITTALAAGDTITVTHLSSGGRNAAVSNFTGTGATHDVTATGSATQLLLATGQSVSVTVAAASELSSVPQLLIAAVGEGGIGGNGMTVAFESSFTESIEHTSGNSGDVALGFRVDTSLDAKITALTDWYSDAITTPAGTVTAMAGSTTVTGVGTTFTAHAPGDRIVISNDTRIIESIESDTSLTVTVEWTTTYSALAYSVRVGNRLITATSGGNIFKEKPSSLTTGDLDAVTLKSGLVPLRRPGRFVHAGKEAAALARRLFYFNGVDVPQVLSGDGTSMTDIDTATNPADWADTADQGQQPINGTVHQDRLAAWGNLNDPHRVYFSSPDDHDDWTAADAFDMRFRSEIGDRIYCGISHQGILFVWKYPRGIFYLDDSEVDDENWVVRTKSESLGCAPSPYAALSVDDDVLFMDPNGHFHLLSAVDAFGGVRNSDVTLRLGLAKWTRDNLNLKRLEQVVSYWYPQKKLAVFYAPGAGEDENTLTLKFDFSGAERGLPLKFSFSTRDEVGAAAVRRASDGGPETPVIGEGEFVYLADQEARNKNGLGYTARYQLPHLDFSHIDPRLRWHRKNYEHLELVMEPVSAGTVTVEVFVDGVFKETLTFDATKRRQKRSLSCGSGWTISFRVTNSTVNEDFKILSHFVYFEVAGQEYSYGNV